MSFMKDFLIYENKEKKVKISINECHNKGKKTKLFTIRQNDKNGFGYILGIIKFHPSWWQYVTEFEPNTIWSSGCKKKLCEFEDILNKKWRKKLRG